MTRYRLRVPQAGDTLYGDGIGIVADTLDEARELWEDYDGEPAIYVHSYIGPLAPLPLAWRDIPVGMTARHLVWGEGEVCARPRAWRGHAPLIPVLFHDGRRADLLLGQVQLFYGVTYGTSCPPPPTRYELTVQGEVVASGVTDRTAHVLLDIRRGRFAAYESCAHPDILTLDWMPG